MSAIAAESPRSPRPRVHFDEIPPSKLSTSKKRSSRSISGSEPTFMSPLSFENVDLKNTPLSSLRSCSEYNKFQIEEVNRLNVEHSAPSSFFSQFFSSGKQRKSRKQENFDNDNSFLVEKFRFNSANLLEGEYYVYDNQDSTDNCFGSVRFEANSRKPRSPAKVSILGESSIAFDYLFGFKVGAPPEMEIELKNLNEPKALSVFNELGTESELERDTNFQSLPDSEVQTLRRVTSYRNFERVPLVEPVLPQPTRQSDQIVVSQNENRQSSVQVLWTKIVEQLRVFFPPSRGDDLFYDSIRLQPFSSGAYLRCMLLAGLSSTFFQIYNLMTWPDRVSSSPINTYVQLLLYINLWVQIVLNVLQLPFRLHIHFLCWESSRAVEVDNAINLIRTMLRSDSWLLNKVLGKSIDLFIVLNLIFTEIYLWISRREDPLRTLVISLCATNLLTVVSRVVVATLFAFSMHDPFVLSEARRRGLSKWDLEVLPTFVFSHNEEVTNCECPICLCGFEMGEMLISLPCDKKHSFHANCIRQWLQRQNSCPLCQRLV